MSGALASVISQNKNPTATSEKYFINEIQDDLGLSGNCSAGPVLVDSSKNIYMSLRPLNASSGGYVSLVKYNKDGTLIWKRSLADLNSADLQSSTPGFLMNFDPNQTSIVLSIQFKNVSGGNQILFARYTLDGTLVFQRLTTPPVAVAAANYYDFPDGVIVSNDGFYWGFGGTTNSDGTNSAILIKGAMSNGALTFNRYYTDSSGASNSEFWSADFDSDGNIYAGGLSKGINGGNIGLITKYTSAGAIVWNFNIFDIQGDAIGSVTQVASVIVNKDIIYVFGTFSYDTIYIPQARRLFVLKMDLNGNVLNYKTFKRDMYQKIGVSPTLNKTEGTLYPYQAIIDLQENFHIMCNDNIGGTVIVKIDKNLNLINSKYIGLIGNSICIDSNNNIYVAGSSNVGSGYAGFLLKYEGLRDRPASILILGSQNLVFKSDYVSESNDIITISTSSGVSTTGTHTNSAGAMTAGTAPTLGVFTNTEYK